jgi:uncharacterized protein with HEPN domain
MSKHNDKITLGQMLVYSREAVEMIRGKTRSDLDQDRLLNLALSRLVEMIGEAAHRVPDDIQAKYPDLPWLQVVGARNRLIHGYDSVDFDILWNIVEQDLPKLIIQLQQILDQL